MKITNSLGLPEALVAAINNDPYDNAGTLSVTTLLKPAQAVALTQKHNGEIVEDAADRIWSLMGQIGHAIIERAAPLLDQSRYISERRYFMPMNGRGVPGYDPLVVSGQVDLIDVHEATVYDFKFTSGWAVMDARRRGKSDWRYQLSLLAMLAREGLYNAAPGISATQPVEITHGKIVAVVRDWTQRQADKSRDFPQKPVEVIDMEIMSDAETREWLDQRIEGLKFALGGGDVPCSDEERWIRPGGWAVYKGKNKTAARVMPTEEELSAWIFANRSKLGDTYRIEERPSTYARCSQYCAAAPFCQQYQETKTASESEEGDD